MKDRRYQPFLETWRQAGLLTEQQRAAILAFEAQRSPSASASAMSAFGQAMMAVAAFAVVLGITAVVSANWEGISGDTKTVLQTFLCLTCAGFILLLHQKPGWNPIQQSLVVMMGGLILSFIGLTGQIFHLSAPAWQTAGLWLLFVTPFTLVLCTSKWTLTTWIIGILVFIVAFGIGVAQDLSPLWTGDESHQSAAGVAAFVLLVYMQILVGSWPRFDRRAPHAASLLRSCGYILLVLLACAVNVLIWRAWVGDLFFPLVYGGSAAAIGSFFLYILRAHMVHTLKGRSGRLLTVGLPILCLGSLYARIMFSDPAVAQRDMFGIVESVLTCAILSSIAYYCAKYERPGLMRLCVYGLMLRVFLIFVEVFGGLLMTGWGLIISGIAVSAAIMGYWRWRSGKRIKAQQEAAS